MQLHNIGMYMRCTLVGNRPLKYTEYTVETLGNQSFKFYELWGNFAKKEKYAKIGKNTRKKSRIIMPITT